MATKNRLGIVWGVWLLLFTFSRSPMKRPATVCAIYLGHHRQIYKMCPIREDTSSFSDTRGCYRTRTPTKGLEVQRLYFPSVKSRNFPSDLIQDHSLYSRLDSHPPRRVSGPRDSVEVHVHLLDVRSGLGSFGGGVTVTNGLDSSEVGRMSWKWESACSQCLPHSVPQWLQLAGSVKVNQT